MPDYNPKTWQDDDYFTADDATKMSQELEEQEQKDAQQDASISAGVAKDAAQDAAISSLRLSNHKRANLPVELYDDGGFSTIPRWASGVSQTALVNNALHWSHFTAERDEVRSSITIHTGQAGNGPAPSLVRLGVWKVQDEQYIPLSYTDNNPSLLADPWSRKTQGLWVPVEYEEGQEYAWGILAVKESGETTWLRGLPNILYEDSIEPRIQAAWYNLTDLPNGNLPFETWQACHVGLLYARFT